MNTGLIYNSCHVVCLSYSISQNIPTLGACQPKTTHVKSPRASQLQLVSQSVCYLVVNMNPCEKCVMLRFKVAANSVNRNRVAAQLGVVILEESREISGT